MLLRYVQQVNQWGNHAIVFEMTVPHNTEYKGKDQAENK